LTSEKHLLGRMKSKLDKLEMLRGFAALYVFAGHFSAARLFPKNSDAGLFLRFGQEAVMLFFLLSGFVVYYSTAKNGDTDFRPYFIRRLRRIYPIFLLALIISGINAVMISSNGQLDFSFPQLFGNLFMLQDFKGGKPGVWVSPLFGNVALWSLSYEWWFYMLFFPIYRYVRPNLQIHVVAALSIAGFVTFTLHPNQLSLFLMYFILWWCGAELARSYLEKSGPTFASQKTPIIYLTILTALAASPAVYSLRLHQHLSFGMHPILELRHFGACLVFVVGGLAWARARWMGFRQLFGVFAFVAPISYALYVFHYPLAVKSSFLSAMPIWLQIIGYLLITFLMAYLAEVPFQNWINRVTSRFTRRAVMQPAMVGTGKNEGGTGKFDRGVAAIPIQQPD
jgi:peptidoglycan/LPS O-acetylase OafA/YrhL